MKDYHTPLVPNHFYHIFNRGNNKETLFSNEDNYFFFIQKIEKYLLPFMKIYAYCLLPNHFLLKVRSEKEILENLTKISKFSKVDIEINRFLEERFQRFFISYSLAYNKQQNRTGSLFQKRFKRIHIDTERYLLKLLHYIHNNPIHHHFCKNFNDWKFSSYNAIVSHGETNIERDSVIGWFDDVNHFIDFHNQMIDYGEIKNFLVDNDIAGEPCQTS